MSVTAVGENWRKVVCYVTVGTLCGVVFAASPHMGFAADSEKSSAKDSQNATTKNDKEACEKEKKTSSKSGTSLLGAVINLLAGESVVEETVTPASNEEAAEPAEESVPTLVIGDTADQPWKLAGATHQQSKAVKIEKKGIQSLQTFCVTPQGDLVAVIGPPRYGVQNGKNAPTTSELQMFDGEGEPLRKWTVDFVAQAVTAAPDGTIIAAGSGQIARFSAEGTLIKQAELQHVKDALGDEKKLREGAEELLEEQRERVEEFFKDQKEQLQTRIEKLKADLEKAEEGSKTHKTKSRQLASAERSLKQIGRQQEQMVGRQSVDDVIRDLTMRLRIVNSVTATNEDVFLACGVMNGYGYAVWRMTSNFDEPKQIVNGLSGCCGQMDIHCHGEELYVAENSRHRVVCYNREGKQVRTFGNRAGQSGGQFGGCCNPMNLCFDSDGSVLTAESEGIVRKFTEKGDALGPVGGCKISGGCKNVAIGVSPDGEKVYFCDLPGSRIIVMARNPEPTEDPDRPADSKSQTN